MKKVLLLGDVNSSHTRKWAEQLVSQGAATAIHSLTAPHDDWAVRLDIRLTSGGRSASRSEDSVLKLGYLADVFSVRSAIRAFRPDVVHAHYATSYGLLGALSGFHPYVISCWGSDVKAFPAKSILHKWLVKFNLGRADAVFVTSPEIARCIRALSPKEPVITPFGINVDTFAPAVPEPGASTGRLVIGTLKSLEPIYRIDAVIRAFHRVRLDRPDRDLHLVIVGGGSCSRSLNDLAERLGVGGAVTFAGRVSPSDVPRWIAGMDLLVNVPSYESFGVSVLEAMACGKPVIVTGVGGLRDLVTDGREGLVVNKDAPGALESAMLALVDDAGLRDRMGRAGRARVLADYNIAGNFSRIMEQYEKLNMEKTGNPKPARQEP